jgi:glycosyltransferase involved in cell wall biosynthesis
VLPPAIDVTPVDADARRAVRAKWGIDDATFVVGALTQPMAWSDARQVIDLVGRAALTERPVSLVLHPTAARRAESVRWAGAIGLGPNMIFDARMEEPWRVVAGLDAALMIRDEWNAADLRDAGSLVGLIMGGGRTMRPVPGVLPALWAMGAGVPLITEDLPAVQNLVRHDETGFLVDPNDVNAVTEQILRMYDDPNAKRQVGDAARTLVEQRFSADAFCAGLDSAYQQVAGLTTAVAPS